MNIAKYISSVTPEQIGAAHKVIAADGHCFYLVENSKHEVDENGDLIEYKVEAFRKDGRWGFTCTCESGKRGFANVKHPSGTCWHVRAALAASAEEKAALKELAAKEEEVKAPVVEKTARPDYKRVNGVEVYAPDERKVKSAQKAYQPRAFSLMR